MNTSLQITLQYMVSGTSPWVSIWIKDAKTKIIEIASRLGPKYKPIQFFCFALNTLILKLKYYTTTVRNDFSVKL